MTWLVTGGAGYIGAHVVRELLAADMPLTVLDDLSTGRLDFIPAKVSFTRGTVLDGAVLERVFDEHDVTGVVHLAGSTDDAGSVRRPLHAYEQNVDATTVLLAAMQDRGIDRLVFTSSLAVHGGPIRGLLDEEQPPAPLTPFAETKLVGEWLLRAQTVAAGLRHTALRLPAVIGTSDPAVFDPRRHAPLAGCFAAIAAGERPSLDPVVRDYVHVADIAAVILAAARRLDAGQPLDAVYDLGGGAGTPLPALAAAVSAATGAAVEPPIGEGGELRIVASGVRAARDLEWRMRHPLADSVASAWAAHQAAATI